MEYFVRPILYSLFQTRRLNKTTIADIVKIAPASKEKSVLSAAKLMTDPRPLAVKVLPLNITYSATMLAFHAPPAAVTQPVTM